MFSLAAALASSIAAPSRAQADRPSVGERSADTGVAGAENALLADEASADRPEVAGPSTEAGSGDAFDASATLRPEEIRQIRALSNEIQEFRSAQMEAVLQERLLDWAKTRFWVIAVLSAVVGVFGVRALTRELLQRTVDDTIKAAARAEAAADLGFDTLTKLKEQSAAHQAEVQRLGQQAVATSEQFEELRSRIDAEGTRAVAAASLKVDGLHRQIGELTATISRLDTSTEEQTGGASDLRELVQRANAEAKHAEAEFAENSGFKVYAISAGDSTDTPSVERIVEDLSIAGFRAAARRDVGGAGGNGRVAISWGARGDAAAGRVRERVRRTLADVGSDMAVEMAGRKDHLTPHEIAVFM